MNNCESTAARLAASRGEPVEENERGRDHSETISDDRVRLKKVIQEIRELREGATLGDIEIRELIDEGRRY